MVNLCAAIVFAMLVLCSVGDEERDANGYIRSSQDSSDFDDRIQPPPFMDELPTALERAHWCRLSNGTYVAYGEKFIHRLCTLCQCTPSRAVHCQALQCLPTYCIDGSMPQRKDGQCCAQCEYDNLPSSCQYNGTAYPHGSVLKTVGNKMQCWCQLGNIECRQYIGTLFDSLDLWADGVTLYIICLIMFAILVFGLLLCSCCTFLIYYGYQRNEIAFQQAYDQYFTTTGWEPVEEVEEYATEVTGDEKQLEAEGCQSEKSSPDFPPPYHYQTN